jgi:hypothetical protein
MKSLTIAILLTAIFYSFPTVVLADCPDEGRCWIAWGGSATQYQELGTFKTPTCYKFGKGCRPWHCEGYKDTKPDYWLNKCVQTFNVTHTPSRSGEILWVTFKGGIVGNYSRELK